jgi:hypothetical protein
MVVALNNKNLVFTSSYDATYMMYFGRIAFVIGIVYLIINFHKVKNKVTKIYYKAFLIFLFLLLYSLFDDIRIRYIVENAIKTGTYKVVQGQIENYDFTRVNAGYMDEFDIDGINFQIPPTGFGSYQEKLFYTAKNKNMPIQENGQNVKIHYITISGENKIIKMWVYPKDTK